jgi:hypothetical protein
MLAVLLGAAVLATMVHLPLRKRFPLTFAARPSLMF